MKIKIKKGNYGQSMEDWFGNCMQSSCMFISSLSAAVIFGLLMLVSFEKRSALLPSILSNSSIVSGPVKFNGR
ncbi:hypothetical protein BH23THE1_BH23THE1_23060 [soil metagenome]